MVIIMTLVMTLVMMLIMTRITMLMMTLTMTLIMMLVMMLQPLNPWKPCANATTDKSYSPRCPYICDCRCYWYSCTGNFSMAYKTNTAMAIATTKTTTTSTTMATKYEAMDNISNLNRPFCHENGTRKNWTAFCPCKWRETQGFVSMNIFGHLGQHLTRQWTTFGTLNGSLIRKRARGHIGLNFFLANEEKHHGL